VRQFRVRNHNTYWLPRLAIEPSRTAALAVRSQISRAISGVSGVSAGRLLEQSSDLVGGTEIGLVDDAGFAVDAGAFDDVVVEPSWLPFFLATSEAI
jgi:hypothetical protein